MGQRCDLAVVVGGDGTMLGIARELARWNLPLVGINQGRLGFITDIPIGPVQGCAGAHDHGRLRSRDALDAAKAMSGATASASPKAFRSTTWWSAAVLRPAWWNCASMWTATLSPTCAPTA
jgi:hypothetical protein